MTREFDPLRFSPGGGHAATAELAACCCSRARSSAPIRPMAWSTSLPSSAGAPGTTMSGCDSGILTGGGTLARSPGRPAGRGCSVVGGDAAAGGDDGLAGAETIGGGADKPGGVDALGGVDAAGGLDAAGGTEAPAGADVAGAAAGVFGACEEGAVQLANVLAGTKTCWPAGVTQFVPSGTNSTLALPAGSPPGQTTEPPRWVQQPGACASAAGVHATPIANRQLRKVLMVPIVMPSLDWRQTLGADEPEAPATKTSAYILRRTSPSGFGTSIRTFAVRVSALTCGSM